MHRIPLLAAIHELASRRPEGQSSTAFMDTSPSCSIAMTVDSLARHRDEYNNSLNNIYGLPVLGTGGEVWISLDLDEKPDRVHPLDEFPVDCDWDVAIDVYKDLYALGQRWRSAQQLKLVS
eukprot:6457922-Amphidinium_carterae.2